MKGRDKSVTIRTVAARAGVSAATVSRYFNTPHTVTEENRKKIGRSIAELNFIPDPVARALGSCVTENIAVLVPNITNPLWAQVTSGIVEELDEGGVSALLCDCREDEERVRKFIASLPAKIINGAIVVSDCGSAAGIEALARIMPVVLVDPPERARGVDAVGSDLVQGMELLVRHLAGLGHRRIALLAGDATTGTSHGRVAAFDRAMRAAGLPVERGVVDFCAWSIKGGYEGLSRLIGLGKSLSAVVCGNDVIALGALGAAHALGLSVPEDLSVAGFDDSPNGEFSVPPLTTLDYPATEIGRMAARLVVGRAERDETGAVPKPRTFTLPLELIPRNSTGPAPEPRS